MGYELDDVVMPPLGPAHTISNLFSMIKEKGDARAVLLAISVAASSVAPAATLAAGIFGSLISLFVAIRTSQYNLLFISISILILVGSSSFSLANLLHNRRIKRFFIHDSLVRNFKIKQLVSIALIKNKSITQYRLRYVVKAKRPVKQFRWRFSWTGEGDIIFRLANPSHSYHFESEGDWKVLVVDLGRLLSKTSTENIDFDIFTANITKDPLPYVGFMISSPEFPKFNSHLIVKFDKGVKVGGFYKETTMATLFHNKLSDSAVYLNEDREIRWMIPVQLGMNFIIRWAFV